MLVVVVVTSREYVYGWAQSEMTYGPSYPETVVEQYCDVVGLYAVMQSSVAYSSHRATGKYVTYDCPWHVMEAGDVEGKGSTVVIATSTLTLTSTVCARIRGRTRALARTPKERLATILTLSFAIKIQIKRVTVG